MYSNLLIIYVTQHCSLLRVVIRIVIFCSMPGLRKCICSVLRYETDVYDCHWLAVCQ